MADFATPEELASYMQMDLDRSTAELNLAITSAAIRSACGWSISQEINTTFTVNGSGRTHLFLPTLRLTAVASVVESGVTVAPAYYQFALSGILYRLLGSSWTSDARAVVVTATHGYATVPAEIKGACLEYAARAFASPEGGLRSYTVGSVSETYSASGTATRSIADDPRVTAYRLPTIG